MRASSHYPLCWKCSLWYDPFRNQTLGLSLYLVSKYSFYAFYNLLDSQIGSAWCWFEVRCEHPGPLEWVFLFQEREFDWDSLWKSTCVQVRNSLLVQDWYSLLFSLILFIFRHLLWNYRQNNPDTICGSPPPNGHPGFNSGVMLLHLDHMRTSYTYNSYLDVLVVDELVKKLVHALSC